MISILVTGANGQLGSSIREASKSCQGIDFRFTDLPELNLADQAGVESLIREVKPHYVINCAAYTDVDGAENDPDTAYLLNRDVPEFLGRLSGSASFRLIHISTDYVFDGMSGRPHREEDIPNPATVYGKSKLAGEQALSGTSAVIVRTAWLYSPVGHNFVKTILKLAKEKDGLEVVYDQTGAPTFAPDLAKAILDILQNVEAGKVPWTSGIFHFTNSGVCSWFDLALATIRMAGIECDVRPVTSAQFARPAPRPHFSVLSTEKIRSVYQVQIPYWRDSLNTCIEILQNTQYGKQ